MGKPDEAKQLNVTKPASKGKTGPRKIDDILKLPVESIDNSLNAQICYDAPFYVTQPNNFDLSPTPKRSSFNFPLSSKKKGKNNLDNPEREKPIEVAYTGHFELHIPETPEPYISDVLKIEPGMIDWFHEKSPPHPFYIQYRMYQAKALNNSSRRFLSMHLNPPVDMGLSAEGFQKDWPGLADCMGKSHQFTHNLERFKDPTGELLLTWQTEEGSTIGRLLSFLQKMDRYDILEDLKFMELIKQSCRDYDLEREKELRLLQAQKEMENPDKSWTVGDVGKEKKEMFDAFVCFSDEDYEFMTEMLRELEEDRCHKLCVDVRDLLDHQDHSITAEVIKERCQRTIVILSRNFVREDNKLCEFAMRVAQSLSPAAQRSKIIPILIDPECQVPTSLRHLTLVDYTRIFQKRYMWTKIAATMEDTTNYLYLVEQEKLRHVTLDASDEGDNLRQVIKDKYEEDQRRKQEEAASRGEVFESSNPKESASSSSSSSNGVVTLRVVPNTSSATYIVDSPSPCELPGKKYSEKAKKSIKKFFKKKKSSD